MQPLPRSSRTPIKLANSLDRQLHMYALTATAAGVAMLALAQPVEAKIIYTPANEKFLRYHPGLILDLNHDGTTDFVLALDSRASSGGYRWNSAIVYGYQSGNQVIATKGGHFNRAVALRAGARIGPGRQFSKGADSLVTEIYHYGRGFHSTNWSGQWGNGGKGLKNRYLGLKFMIGGQVHFGWARVTVKTTSNTFTATLTGYAYETIPNKSIIAGRTKGQDNKTGGERVSPASVAAPPEPATLGALALGAQGVPQLRKKSSVSTTR